MDYLNTVLTAPYAMTLALPFDTPLAMPLAEPSDIPLAIRY